MIPVEGAAREGNDARRVSLAAVLVMLRVLGPLEIEGVSGVGGPQQRRVLAILAASLGHSVSRDALVDALWEEPPATAVKTLQAYLSRLRRVLPDGMTIVTTSGGYALEAAVEAVDVSLVRSLAGEADRARARGDVDRGLPALDHALALYRGEPFAEFSGEPFARAAVTELTELRERLREDRVEALLAMGRQASLIASLETMVLEHPFRERRWSQLATALDRMGRRADALDALGRARRVLAEELGMDPGPALQELERELLTSGGPKQANRPAAQAPVALPTGSVTFVLTDIEGSTRRWRDDAEGMASLVQRHERVIADTVTEHDGVFLKWRGEGDATFSVFPRPSHAIAAALAFQRSLADVLPVRVAIHTGEAATLDGDYYGHEVNRAARLRELAHGGQVLVSATVRLLAGERLPEGAMLRPLGLHVLRDIGGPEDLYQLVHPDLRDDFPPLRSSMVGAGLPRRATTFVGRATELDELSDLVRDHRFVTVIGPGGVGKTRLALEVADRLTTEFEAVWFVPLADVARSDLVDAALASALDVRTDVPSPRQAVAERVGARNVLLVLDNCEHVLDPVGTAVRSLLDACPNMHVLATSRTRVALGGEQAWDLRPLAMPRDAHDLSADAVRLLIERISAADASFRPTPETAAALTAICRHVDGLPLALELAAAKAAVLSAQELEPRLLRSLEVLSSRQRDVPARQRTMQAVLDWSYALLSTAERRLYRRLGVFEGGFSLSAAEAVCGGSDLPAADVIEVLTGLIEHSLVERHSEVADRFRLLSVVRHHALEHLRDADEEVDLRAAHLRWCLSLVGGADGLTPLSAERTRRLASETGNVRAALTWALSVGDVESALRLAGGFAPVWFVRGAWDEAAQWLLDVLRAAPGPSAARVVAASHLATIAHMRGDRQLAEDSAAEVVDHADAVGVPRARTRALVTLSELAAETGRDADARDAAQRAIASLDADDRAGRAGALHALASVLPDLSRRRSLLREAAEDALAAGDDHLAAIALFKLAKIEVDPADAMAARARSMRLLEELDAPEGRAAVLLDAAVDAAVRGDVATAIEDLDRCLTVLRGIGHGRHLPTALVQGALALHARGAGTDARRLVAEAAEASRHAGPVAGHLAALRAAFARDDGQLVDALTACRAALRGMNDVTAATCIVLAVTASVVNEAGRTGLAGLLASSCERGRAEMSLSPAEAFFVKQLLSTLPKQPTEAVALANAVRTALSELDDDQR